MRGSLLRRPALLLVVLLVHFVVPTFASSPPATAGEPPEKSPEQERADAFLSLVNSAYLALRTVAQRADWDAATDVSPEHDAASSAAAKALAAFNGNPAIIRGAKDLLRQGERLDSLTVRQLREVLLNAAEGPMTNPDLVARRIEAETRQASIMNGFTFELDGHPITANEIDDSLTTLTDPGRRRAVWDASKLIGPALKPGLVELRELRNGVARELDYPDYFALQVAGHDMSVDEMLAMQDAFLDQLRPLYLELHAWARAELARRYHQPVPKLIPAHWLPNRWGQEWEAMVPVPGLDQSFGGRSAEWIVKTGENFYTSLGLPPLPESFWKNSDLYPLPATSVRKKNAHASCWHIDLDGDIRALMSVEPNEYWFDTVHHELGHAFYDIAYSRPEVPPLLRTGASPAFHEGMASVAEVASRQTPYLESLGLLRKGKEPPEITTLLHDALVTIPFMFFCSGTMTRWESDIYSRNLPSDQWNARWWDYAARYQGIEPPSPRGEEFCDPATKTHINDAPAYYFSYAIATVIQYQVHDAIARRVLHQDPHHCNYAGHPEVGAFLASMERPGKTEDWRRILRRATGEDLSTRAMVDYYRPLLVWLKKQNRGRPVGW